MERRFGKGETEEQTIERLKSVNAEMLAALKATLTALESHLDADANHANLKHRDQLCPCNSNEVQQARAAIQKAEGGK